MGTPAVTVFKDEQGETLAILYRQSDGYLSGQGAELLRLLSGKRVVNGYNGEDRMLGHFNGAQDMAVRVLAGLKRLQGERCAETNRAMKEGGEPPLYPDDTSDMIGLHYLWPATTTIVRSDEPYLYEVGVSEKVGRFQNPTLSVFCSGVLVYSGPVDGFDVGVAERGEAAARA